MNPTNRPHSNGWTTEFEVAQQMPNHHHQEPYIVHGGSTNFPQSNSHQILPHPGSIANLDFYHLPQYATASNLYNPYLNPAIDRIFSIPQNCGASSAQVDGFVPDGFRGLSKRNAAECFVGNIQCLNAPAVPSSSMPPSNACHFDGGVAVVDAFFPFAEYRGNYFGQSFQPSVGPNAVGDGSTLLFDPSPASSYFQVSSINASSSEIGNVGGQRFHGVATTNRAVRAPMLSVLHDFHHLQNVQGTSGYDLNYHLPAVATSSRHSINNAVHHGNMSHTQTLPPGIRIYRSHRDGIPESVNRHPDLPNLRLLPEEGLAILEFPGHHEMGTESPIDHHGEMQLDIDYMSYEELLALSEHIGNVDTGLSDEAITGHLKARVYRSSMTTINLEELPCNN